MHWRHSCRSRLLKASMNALSVGFPRCEKSSVIPFRYAHWFSIRPANSGVVNPKALRLAAKAKKSIELFDNLVGAGVRSRCRRERLSRMAVDSPDSQSPPILRLAVQKTYPQRPCESMMRPTQ